MGGGGGGMTLPSPEADVLVSPKGTVNEVGRLVAETMMPAELVVVEKKPVPTGEDDM